MGAINYPVAFAFVASDVNGTALDLEDLGFSASDIAEANEMWVCSIGTDDIKFRIDGGTATATDGHIIAQSGKVIQGNYNISNFSCILKTGGSSARIAITLFK